MCSHGARNRCDCGLHAVPHGERVWCKERGGRGGESFHCSQEDHAIVAAPTEAGSSAEDVNQWLENESALTPPTTPSLIRAGIASPLRLKHRSSPALG